MKSPAMLGVIVDEPAEPKRKDREKRTRDEVVSDAHAAKRRATAAWTEGHITTEEHRAIHARADHVIKTKGLI